MSSAAFNFCVSQLFAENYELTYILYKAHPGDSPNVYDIPLASGNSSQLQFVS